MMRCLSVPATGFSRSDIVSDALNRSVKIQEAAGENEFHIGYSLYELIHVQWLERCSFIEEGEAGLPNYRVFKVN